MSRYFSIQDAIEELRKKFEKNKNPQKENSDGENQDRTSERNSVPNGDSAR